MTNTQQGFQEFCQSQQLDPETDDAWDDFMDYIQDWEEGYYDDDNQATQ